MSAEMVQGTIDPETSVSVLTAHDRCDGCGAQAYVKYELLAGGELLFCLHDNNKHADKLKGTAVLVVDERHKLS